MKRLNQYFKDSSLSFLRRAVLGLVFATVIILGSVVGSASAVTVPTCGQSGIPTIPLQHIIIVMLENHSYKQVVGNSSAPFQTTLSKTCGVATAAFGATHTSAVNYLALSAGQYPAASPKGCGSVSACSDASSNLYSQLSSQYLSWRGYVESMPSACAQKSIFPYKIGHNPELFYTKISKSACLSNDVPVNDLTAQSGALWTDLQNQTLPSLSWITPNLNNDGEAAGGGSVSELAADNWLKAFVGTVSQSNSYLANNTAILVTYDEGTGSDSKVGEDCTNISLDMPVSSSGISAHQDSCHVALFVIYPYTVAGTHDGTFFDHYSITKTVEDTFGLPYLAHANDTQTTSLVGHFGIPKP